MNYKVELYSGTKLYTENHNLYSNRVGVRERGRPRELDAIYRPEKELLSIDQSNPRIGFGSGRKWRNVVVYKTSPPDRYRREDGKSLARSHSSFTEADEGRAIPSVSVVEEG